MKHGINKISIISGHTLGTNHIPAKYSNNDIEKAYNEGTAMFKLAELLENIEGVENVRHGDTTAIKRSRRGDLMGRSGSDVCIAMHTNWSVGRGDVPTTGIMKVIVPIYNPIHNLSEQEAMAEKLYKPLADTLGLQLSITSKKGGGSWDFYTYLQACCNNQVPYPVLIEFGYHQDYANNQEFYRTEIYKLLADLCDDTRGVPTVEYATYKVNNTRLGRSSLTLLDENYKWTKRSYANGTVVKIINIETNHLYAETPDGEKGYFPINYVSPHGINVMWPDIPPVIEDPEEPANTDYMDIVQKQAALIKAIHEMTSGAYTIPDIPDTPDDDIVIEVPTADYLTVLQNSLTGIEGQSNGWGYKKEYGHYVVSNNSSYLTVWFDTKDLSASDRRPNSHRYSSLSTEHIKHGTIIYPVGEPFTNHKGNTYIPFYLADLKYPDYKDDGDKIYWLLQKHLTHTA